MAIIKCKMCGGDITIAADKTFGTCEYCGSTMTLPKVDDDQRAAAFNRGNHFRRIGEFDKALAVYERIVAEDNTDAEAHWCCALCRFGIEYVEDPATYEYLPTCHRASFDSILEDVDYLAAVEYSDGITRRQYQKDAAKIAEVQRGILATSSQEEPFDVFICYKESDAEGNRTRDSLLAQEVYYQLTEQGYRVFFSRITLEDKVGTQYEPYIFAALNSAKVMVAIGTKEEHFNAVWVKNEWSRFLALMKKDRSKLLLPCYRDMDPYDMPEALSVLQSYDMGKIGFIQDLVRGIGKVLHTEPVQTVKETVVVQSQQTSSINTAPLLKRALMFLEDRDWESAEEYCEKVLDIDPECAEAYLGKLMAELEVCERTELKNCDEPFDWNGNYKKAVRFADDKLKNELNSYIEHINARIAEKLRAEAEREKIEAERARIEEERAQEQARIDAEKRKKMIPYFSDVRNKISPVANLIFAGGFHSLGVNLDGTVAACGPNYDGKCNIAGRKDIVAVSAGDSHSLGLKADGTVISYGENYNGECNVYDWKDIVAVSAGGHHSLGLQANGMVVACGSNSDGKRDVFGWRDIVAISAGYAHSLGLKADGTVVSCGRKDESDVAGWRNVVAVSAGGEYSLGLKSDGTVISCGENKHGRCNTGDWECIVAVSAGLFHSLGLKADGTVVACGKNDEGQCNVDEWRDIVAVSAGSFHSLGLKADGTVVACGESERNQCDVVGWKLFNDYENYAEERKITVESEHKAAEERVRQRQKLLREQGVCQHCGGAFKGLFSKKCGICGKEKDY